MMDWAMGGLSNFWTVTMQILVIDHRDSFTYNLVDAFRTLGYGVAVVDSSSWGGEHADTIVLSPGPGRPSDYPETQALVTALPPDTPLLGVCLGMQILNEWSGGETIHAPQPMHGKVSVITHNGRGIFDGLPSPCTAMRYHSLVCRVRSEEWEVTARTDEDIPMALQHRQRPWYGVQFHPESFMTPDGRHLLNNFVRGVMK
jgi:anthranilate synthase component 2